jgi:hypothetical protein
MRKPSITNQTLTATKLVDIKYTICFKNLPSKAAMENKKFENV